MYIFSKKVYSFVSKIGIVSSALLGLLLISLVYLSEQISGLPIWEKLLITIPSSLFIVGFAGLIIALVLSEKLYVYPESVYFHTSETDKTVVESRAVEKKANYFTGKITDEDGGSTEFQVRLPKDVLNVIPYSYRGGHRYVFAEFITDGKGEIKLTGRAWAMNLPIGYNYLDFNG